MNKINKTNEKLYKNLRKKYMIIIDEKAVSTAARIF